MLSHADVLERLTALQGNTAEEIKSKYSEAELRYCLMTQLVATTGKRSDAIVNMKIGPLQKVRKTADDCWW